jgi:UDP-sugar transporter A1/2/3
VIQNNLTFLATTNLPAEIYQALSNMKIVSTAIFTVTFLRRPQSTWQWMSIFALTLGIVAVQLSQEQGLTAAETVTPRKYMFFGSLCVLSAATLSGFAGVYFEMVLKNTNSSIWMRNIQLAVISLLFSGFGCYVSDYDEIMRKGFFYNYDIIVLIVITIGAAGGIIVAIVIKFLDNILKGFASGSSIIISCILSKHFLHDGSTFNMTFFSGTFLVCASIVGYAIASSSAAIKLQSSASPASLS